MAFEQDLNKRDKDRERVLEILRKMTLKEKAALLSGKDNWSTISVPRLNIPSIRVSDGPHGVRRVEDEMKSSGVATYFPTGVSMASSWNPELVEQIGTAIAEETRACDCDVILGPCVNIIRHPLAGRNFESFSEDPVLAGKIGAAYVKGVQKNNVGTSLKHFACNNQETERMRSNSVVDERTLREIYLTAFETVVKEAKPWTVMCSYNKLNGHYTSENHHLLTEILRDEWGYEGLVVSDWGANHSTIDSSKAGLDLEMPGPAKHYGQRLQDAIFEWKLDESFADRSAARVLELIMKSGRMDESGLVSNAGINTPKHQEIARDLAKESITLLKNNTTVLPIGKDIKTIAVIGPNADIRVAGGGSSDVLSPYFITALQGLKEVLGDGAELKIEKGCENYDIPPFMDYRYLTSGEESGLSAEYYNNADLSGEPVLKRVDRNFNLWSFGEVNRLGVSSEEFSVRWSGKVHAKSSGRHILKTHNNGDLMLKVDGKSVYCVSNEKTQGDFVAMNTMIFEFDLVEGQAHDIEIEYMKPSLNGPAFLQLCFGFLPRPELDGRINRAVQIAAESDMVLVFAGMPESYESEGADRPHMRLPGRQNELISAVAKANPRTAVVLNTCVPVEMPWIDEVAGLVEAYYMGQEGGHALAEILIGKANPSGKLSMTFPKKLSDTPAFINYPGSRDVVYGEGIFVGYRYYDKRDVDPLFPFGHGLSYTSFKYGELKAPGSFKQGETVTASINIENNGAYDGKEVLQLYVSDPACSVARPLRELKAFKKVEIKKGESQSVQFSLDPRAFSFYDPYKKKWVAEPGEFELQVGSSSRDIRAKAVITLEE